jgi:aquaporin Z
MNKLLVEAIGTFFLVLTVGVTAGRTDFAPLAIGASLMVMVYAGGHLSGGHYNPAVTLGLILRGKIAPGEAVTYMIAQVVGGTLAALTAQFLVGPGFGAPSPGADVSAAQAVVNEILFTFALVWVVLNSATAKGTEGNSFYGLAIGFTVVVGAFAGGGISGGAYNPAVGLGPNLIKGNFAPIWIYLVGPFAGGALAATLFRVCSPADHTSADS